MFPDHFSRSCGPLVIRGADFGNRWSLKYYIFSFRKNMLYCWEKNWPSSVLLSSNLAKPFPYDQVIIFWKLNNSTFTPAFCIFNRNFSISWKLNVLHFQTLKSHIYAVNACVKRQSQWAFKIRLNVTWLILQISFLLRFCSSFKSFATKSHRFPPVTPFKSSNRS